jgi:hypothetical protein
VNTHAYRTGKGIPLTRTKTAAPASRTLTSYMALKHENIFLRECPTSQPPYCLESFSQDSVAREADDGSLHSVEHREF